MKKYLKIAFGIALVLLALNARTANAQVYSDYYGVEIVELQPYTEIPISNKTVIPYTSFGLPPSFAPNPDDGYARVQLPWPFEYNGVVYNEIWVSVNGFATFSYPLALPATESRGLFIDEQTSYPQNVLAPFWGDHYMRSQSERFAGYMPSEISYGTINNDEVFVIQWKNLQLNNEFIKSSIGNFQLKLYKAPDEYNSFQGSIEFCYGVIGGNIYTDSTVVVTRNASIGIKGNSNGFVTGASDFLNGLHPGDLQAARTQTTLTNVWPPSGGTDKCIRFESNIVARVDEWWGDGDVDFSKAPAARHFGLPQNRFVTYNDVRLIMRSVATHIPLDSIRRRAAYHGDVNHDGRFYYTNANVRTDIPWKDMNYADNLPSEVNSIQRIFFQANEFDAAIILAYLSARLPGLPWILDTIPKYGKVQAGELANSVEFGKVANVAENTYQIPVYLNGDFDGPMSVKFSLNQNVTDVVSSYDDVMIDYENSTVVVAGAGKYTYDVPVAYVTFTMEGKSLDITDIKFNQNTVTDLSIAMTGTEDNTQNGVAVTSVPNPFSAQTVITVANLPEGNYELAIYDMLGNKIKNLNNAGKSSFQAIWDGTDMSGAKVESGMYIYKLTGGNLYISNKIIFNR